MMISKFDASNNNKNKNNPNNNKNKNDHNNNKNKNDHNNNKNNNRANIYPHLGGRMENNTEEKMKLLEWCSQ